MSVSSVAGRLSGVVGSSGASAPAVDPFVFGVWPLVVGVDGVIGVIGVVGVAGVAGQGRVSIFGDVKAGGLVADGKRRGS